LNKYALNIEIVFLLKGRILMRSDSARYFPLTIQQGRVESRDSAPALEQTLSDTSSNPLFVPIKHELVGGKRSRSLYKNIPVIPPPLTAALSSAPESKRRPALPERNASATNISVPKASRNSASNIIEVAREASAPIPTIKGLEHLEKLGIYAGFSAAAVRNIPAYIREVVICKGVLGTLIENIPRCNNRTVTMAQGSSSTADSPALEQASVSNLPLPPEPLTVILGASLEEVRNLSTAVTKVVIDEMSSVEVIKNIPSHIKEVIIASGVSVEAVSHIPSHVSVNISAASVEAIKSIPAHITRVGISGSTLGEAVKNIPRHVTQIIIK
jgi:hypothetical protein